MTQKELTDRLDRASRLYYQGKTTEFTDSEFDLHFIELQKMEKESGIVYPNSPTLRVGSDIQDGFKKGKHPKPMLTIENVYDDEGLAKWVEDKFKKYDEEIYTVSIKYDGISCELHYHNGILKKALTRGDKTVGDDITENVKTIKSVPLTIDKEFTKDCWFYVRGEIMLPKSRLAAINEERTAKGERPFANTRNACSGTIKSLDPKEVAKRGLIFRAWDCFGNNFHVAGMNAKFGILEDCGFYYEPETIPELRTYTGDKQRFCEKINNYKKKLDGLGLDYEYDGVVIKIDSVKIQDQIGTKDTRAIEWGIARKWNEENVVETKINDVEWQVGRTGVLTPVGKLDPVECGGVVISNVTLHNIGFIRENKIGYNDIIRITRSGGVIPYVLYKVGPDVEGRPFSPIHEPEKCPICGGKVVKEGELLKCVNPSCRAQEVGKIIQFCSKEGADIKSIGEKVAEDLFDAGLITHITDILQVGDIYACEVNREMTVKTWVEKLGEGYGIVSVENMLNGILEARNHVPFEKLLAGLSIPGVGKVMARTLVKEFHTVFGILNAKVEDFVKIDGIAEITANGIKSWIDENHEILESLDYNGWNWTGVSEVVEETKEMVLEGLNVVFSGKSYRFNGDEVEDFLESYGAKCGHSVSKNTNYLIVGNKPGNSKVEKALKLGVEVIQEALFYEKYNLPVIF